MKKRLLLLLTLLSFICLNTNQTKAATSSSAASASSTPKVTFGVQPQLPKNQTDTSLSYFDLKMTTGMEQTLKVSVYNTGTLKMKVDVSANNAYTADTGITAYNKTNIKLTNPNAASFTSLVQGKLAKTITLAAGETKEVSFSIKMPENQYDGIILGGISVTGDANKSQSGDVMIQNRVSYTTGVVLRETDTLVTPHVNVDKVTPALVENNKGIKVTITNDAAINVSGMKLKATLYEGDPEVKFFSYKHDKMKMAPYSSFDYFIPIKKLEKGQFTLKGTITDSNGYSQDFVKKFSVSETQIKSLKTVVYKKVQPQDQNANKWYLIVSAVAFILLVVLLIFNYTVGFNKKIGVSKNSDMPQYTDDDEPLELTDKEKSNLRKFRKKQEKQRAKAEKEQARMDRKATKSSNKRHKNGQNS